MIGIKVTRKGKSLKRPSVVMDERHMKAIGATIAEPLRATLAAGRDANGDPLAPEVYDGDGIPGHETGALAASIKPRRTSKGKLVVMPDYKKFKYGIYLAIGVNTRRTTERIAAGVLRKRRDYKTKRDMHQVPRPFMGMSAGTLATVADANRVQFVEWFNGLLGAGEARAGLVTRDLPGAIK